MNSFLVLCKIFSKKVAPSTDLDIEMLFFDHHFLHVREAQNCGN